MNEICDDKMIFILEDGVRFLPANRCITNDSGVVINLSENSYRFFSLLLKGEMDKQLIIDQVWHEQKGQVSDSSYYSQIYMLRKALNVAGLSSSLIKTIPRKGVKYIGVVSSEQRDITAQQFIFPAHCDDEGNNCVQLNTIEATELQTFIESPATVPVSPAEGNQSAEWYKSRRWNRFITALSIIAVCWLSSLMVLIIYFIRK